MKTSNVLVSVLFSTMALAAPLDKRAYATKTEVHMEYYTVFTTVTGAHHPAAPTADPAPFHDEPKTQPQQQTTVVTTPSSSSTPTSSSSASSTVAAPEPTTTDYPTVVPATTEKQPEPTTTEEQPEPTTTSVYTPPPESTPTPQAPPPSSTSVAAEPESTQSSTGGGEVHSGGSYTMNYYGGGTGACGDPIDDSAMAVALAVDTFGDATVDYMTGKTNNPWCGKKIEITNQGKTAIAYIKDRCSGCTQGGLDATPALWEATTGGLGGDSGDRIYSMTWKVVS